MPNKSNLHDSNLHLLHLYRFVLWITLARSALSEEFPMFVPPRPPINPAVIVPGIAGSALEGCDALKCERLWVAGLNKFTQERVIRRYLTGEFNATTEIVKNSGTFVRPLQKAAGLGAIDILTDTGFDTIDHFSKAYYPLIKYLESLGYVGGDTLFGFPYDWHQSTRSKTQMAKFHEFIKSQVRRTGKKIDLISHSMGCIFVRSYFALYPNASDLYINSWIALGGPFQGASVSINAFVQGYNFGNPFLSNSVAHEVIFSIPSVYELLPSPLFNWEPPINVTINLGGNRVTYYTNNLTHLFTEVNKNNPPAQRFREELWEFSMKTREMWNSVKFRENFRITLVATTYSKVAPYSLRYNSRLGSFQELIDASSPTILSDVASDGTVALQSACAIGVPGVKCNVIPNLDHLDMLKSSKLQNLVREGLHILCPWEGTWDFESEFQNFSQQGNSVVWLRKKGETRATTQANSLLFPISDNEPDTCVSMEMEDDCLSFKAFYVSCATKEVKTSLLPVPIPIAKTGTRIMGNQCKPQQSLECSVPNGKGRRNCYFGFYSAQCENIECYPGFCLNYHKETDTMSCGHCPPGSEVIALAISAPPSSTVPSSPSNSGHTVDVGVLVAIVVATVVITIIVTWLIKYFMAKAVKEETV